MAKKKEYTWYVEPLDSNTNQAIAELVDAEDFCSKSHLWRCDIGIVLALKRSMKSLNLKFKLYNQQGKGQVREIPLFVLEGKKKRKKIKATS